MKKHPSFRISAAAAARVAAVSAARGGAPLRVEVLAGGCGGFQYRFDLDPSGPAEGDLVAESGGAVVLVDPASLDLLDGAELVWEETLMGGRIAVANPNAASSCGCGASFSA